MLIHTGRAPTRSVLTSALGVSRATAGTVVSELQALSLIQVHDTAPHDTAPHDNTVPHDTRPHNTRPHNTVPPNTRPEPAGAHQQGRPSHRLSLDPAGPVAIAAEIHADGYQVALVGLGAQVVAARSRLAGIAGDPALALAEVARAAARLLANTGRPCVGAGLAVPAAVASPDGVMVGQLGIDWPDGTPVRDLFTEQLLRAGATGPAGQPVSCSAANDINLAALAEHRHGAGRDASHLLMVATGNRGVGGALVLDGALYTGGGGLGMEAGHVSVDPGGRPCPCGSRGCLNVETDAARFLEAAGCPPGQAEAGGTDLARATGLLRRRRDDPAVRAAVSVLTERLAAGLAGLVNVLNPDRILLGGLHRYLLEADPARLRAAVADRSPWGRAAGVPLVPAALEHSALIGAAEIAWQPVLDNPALAPSPRGRKEAMIR
ncbi:MAG TPA: ROK family protein [Trebonia sp.]|nr:ROK family protein [Trebonia sp.]